MRTDVTSATNMPIVEEDLARNQGVGVTEAGKAMALKNVTVCIFCIVSKGYCNVPKFLDKQV